MVKKLEQEKDYCKSGEVQYCKFTAGDCQGYAADHGGQGQE